MILKATRIASGKTQAQVAKEVGITERGYQKIEAKCEYKAARTAIRIAKALKKDTGDMESLFGEEQQSAPDGSGVG